ncbi:glyoxylate/hydroxypyruvate reductase A [Rheinheimera mesophila]|uniref:Glyoxylate/hydroxypyruvate reductase A n=1 Tax=Rheinheimera mesophila TaxID=1547515 RepID=A0A3P3QIL2_9GAMM|nr:glyoxylate/hydroxypyruvate reductase A [Rheinheimera mesophila]KKL02994.1 phosphoglycerate dehydrogenase [Rheinheimera mesophila]RRJ21004.1 glyoxylate/hydroxypyruvate reductase A [Rheinheimera mesophila]
MSIALVIPDRKLDALIEKLNMLLPGVLIQQWPHYTAPDQVQMAVVWKQPQGSLAALSNLKSLQSFGAGVDSIVSDPTLPDLPLSRIVDPALASSMVNYLAGIVLHYQLRLDVFQRQQQKQLWKPKSPRLIKHICVLGLGELGQAAAQYFVQQGYQVSGWSRSIKLLDGIESYAGEEGFIKAVSAADLVICLLPLTPDTNNFLNTERLRAFKAGAILVNVARGAIVDDAALLAALDSGQLQAACLDVFREEPLPAVDPYWQHPAVLVTPHCSAVTNVDTAIHQIVENYQRTLNGLPLMHLVNRERGY